MPILIGLIMEALVAAILSAALPAGWIYVVGDGVDTTPGAYHDSLSGVLIESEIGFPHLHRPWVEGAAKLAGTTTTTTRAGIFTVLTVGRATDAGQCRQRLYRLTDRSHPDLAWNLRFSACTDGQYTRATQMVDWLAKRGWPVASEPAGHELQAHQVTEDFAVLKLGMTWESVQEKVGSGFSVAPGEDGGFVVRYLVLRDWVIMRFSRDRRLTKIDFERG